MHRRSPDVGAGETTPPPRSGTIRGQLPAAATDDRAPLPPDGDAVENALRRLSFALRVRRFYPVGSPVLARKLDEAVRALRGILESASLTLEVRTDRFCWRARGAHGVVVEPALAVAAHERGIASLTFSPPLTREAVAGLLEALCAPPPEPGEESGERALPVQLPGIRARTLQLDQLFADGPTTVSQSDLWQQVLSGFRSERRATVTRWSELARDVPALAELFVWALSPDTQPPGLRNHAQTEAFVLLCEQVGAVSLEEPCVVAANLAEAAVRLFDRLDPEAWLEILADPLPLADNEQADVTRAIATRLDPAQVLGLVRYALRSRSGATPRLYRFFSRVLQGHERTGMATEILRALPRADEEAFARAWPRLFDVLAGEATDPFVDGDYETVLQRPAAEPLGPPAWEMTRLGPRLRELDEATVELARTRVCLALLAVERDPDDARALLGWALAALPLLVQQEAFPLLERLIGRVAAIAADTRHPCRAEASASLADLCRPEIVSAIVRGLASGGDAGRFHLIARIVEQLGPACLPALLQALTTAAGPALRAQLARLLGGLAEFPAGLFEQALRSPQAGYVRDVVRVLAGVERPERIRLLRRAIEHPDAGVRRAALAGLLRAGGPAAEAAILRCLDDPALEVRVAALRSFRCALGAHAPAPRLLHYLSLPNWTGRNNATIVAAIQAAVRLEQRDLIPRLVRLARRPWLFRRRRRPVWSAARRALVQLKPSPAGAGRPAATERAA